MQIQNALLPLWLCVDIAIARVCSLFLPAVVQNTRTHTIDTPSRPFSLAPAAIVVVVIVVIDIAVVSLQLSLGCRHSGADGCRFFDTYSIWNVAKSNSKQIQCNVYGYMAIKREWDSVCLRDRQPFYHTVESVQLLKSFFGKSSTSLKTTSTKSFHTQINFHAAKA